MGECGGRGIPSFITVSCAMFTKVCAAHVNYLKLSCFLLYPLTVWCHIFTGCSQGGRVTFGNTLCTFNRLLRHDWNTLDLFYPWAFVASKDMPGIQCTYSIPGPLVVSYNMPGIQRTYSISGPLVASYNMPGIQWTYSIPGPLVVSYNMPGIQRTYSISEPLVVSHNMPGLQWTYSIPGPLQVAVTHIKW